MRSLRRQLDTVVSAAAAASNGDPVPVPTSSDSLATTSTAVMGETSAAQPSDPMTAGGTGGPLPVPSRPLPVAAQGAPSIFYSIY